MNQVAKIEPAKMMLLEFMADKYSLRVDEFSRTVRATCGLPKASPEEFAAFLIVAKEYNLNPLTKEIYAFPGRSGGIVPIVSIDGWVNLVNSHGACDGFEFEMEHADGKLVSCTCRMYRKDRSRPVVITEYLAECIRGTEPWKMQHRMLRHKSMIQAARYAFGFSGIYDEDEGAKIAGLRDARPIAIDGPPAPPAAQLTHQPQQVTIINEPLQSAEQLVEAGQFDSTDVEWTDELPSGAVASGPTEPASDESSRASAAPSQHGENNMGGAGSPTSWPKAEGKLPPLTGLLADRHRDNLVRQIGSLETLGDMLGWARDGVPQINRLPEAMAEAVRAEFNSRQNRIKESSK